MNNYTGLRRAQLSLDYLHTNSTTHEFLFGALAEMVDNSRDAQATQLEIFDFKNDELRGGFGICFMDDGEGMTPEEAARVVTFGHSEKRAKSEHLIGMYGNGLKSGSMRIGNDLILFAKKNNLLTVLLLSRTFHESEHLLEVIVPVPSFDATTKMPIDDGESDMHRQEVDIILKYSPFKSISDLMTQFDRISGESGTFVMIYNLKLLDTGEPELQFTDNDIVLANPPGQEFDSDEVLHDEQKSFAAYCSILYIDPRMKIYVNGVKVRTRRILSSLYKPKVYKFSSSRFKTRSEGEIKKVEIDATKFEYLAREAESKARDLQKKCVAQLTNTKLRQECRRADEEASRLRQQAQLYKHLIERKKRELKDPKTLKLYFGLQINRRGRDGVFIYNCSRLITMYHRFYDGVPRGLVAVVDVPYLVLEPTHNKQDFADAKEFRHLIRALSEHAFSYCREVGINTPATTDKFWSDFGYEDMKEWNVPPSDEPKFLRKRRAEVPVVIQCDSCLKWRILPFSINPPAEYPPDWHCAMNPDPSCNRCSAPELRQAIPEATFQKQPINQVTAAEKLQEEIRRKQALLAKIKPPSPVEHKPVSSARSSKEPASDTEKSPTSDKAETTNSTNVNGTSPSRNLRVRKSTSKEELNRTIDSDEDEKIKRRRITEGQRSSRTVRNKRPPSDKESEKEEEDEQSEEEVAQPLLHHRRVSPKKKSYRKKYKTPSRSRLITKGKSESDEEEEDKEDEDEDAAEEEEEEEAESGDLSSEDVSDLIESYRACIKYFLPPSWKKFSKNSISKMPSRELVNFPQQEFFDQYETGLKSFVKGLRDDNTATKKQLGNLRRMVASLLEKILDKPKNSLVRTVSDHPDNHEIDDLLETCLGKASGEKKSNGASSSKSNSAKKSGSR